jgi:hypothetical protein
MFTENVYPFQPVGAIDVETFPGAMKLLDNLEITFIQLFAISSLFLLIFGGTR